MSDTLTVEQLVLMHNPSQSKSTSIPFNSRLSNIAPATTCPHERHFNRSSCNQCKQGGKYRLQQQNDLKIQFDRLAHFTSVETGRGNKNFEGIDDRPMTLIPSTSPPINQNQATSPTFRQPLSANLRVVKEFTSDLNLQSEHPQKKTYRRRFTASRKKTGKAPSDENQVVNLESARINLSNRQQQQQQQNFPNLQLGGDPKTWYPPRRIIYANRAEFSNDGQGSERFSRLAKSPSPRQVSTKLVQIDMTLSTPALAPGHQYRMPVRDNAPPQPGTLGENVPYCYSVKPSSQQHDAHVHNPFVNYFKLKQMVTEGKLKLKQIPASEWANLFQPPTSTVAPGGNDASQNTSEGSEHVELPSINKADFVSHWVRRSEMQPLTKFKTLNLEGLRTSDSVYQQNQQQQLHTDGDSSAPLQVQNSYLTPKNSAYLLSQKQRSSKYQTNVEPGTRT